MSRIVIVRLRCHCHKPINLIYTVEVYTHEISTSALCGGEWEASLLGHFFPVQAPSVLNRQECVCVCVCVCVFVCARATSLDIGEKRKLPTPVPNQALVFKYIALSLY
jgi:hypothetical protein